MLLYLISGAQSMAGLFDKHLEAKGIFAQRNVLLPEYTPENILRRDQYIERLADILAPVVNKSRPSNVLIFGKTGSGKTIVTKYVCNELSEASEYAEVVYLNCHTVNTKYGVFYNIASRFTEKDDSKVPFTGWPVERLYNTLEERLDRAEGVAIVVLDEIDELLSKAGDGVLYELMEVNNNISNSSLALIGISNDLNVEKDYMKDAKVKSRLKPLEKIIFRPYDAMQLRGILQDRAKVAFEPNVLEMEVITLCAALATQEGGDARKAIGLLRVCGELAERDGVHKITEKYVYEAEKKLNLDTILEAVRGLPNQSKALLYSITVSTEAGIDTLSSGDAYSLYKQVSEKAGLNNLTQRRLVDLIIELDTIGLINAKVVYKGRHGRTKDIQLTAPLKEVKKILEEDESFKDIKVNLQGVKR